MDEITWRDFDEVYTRLQAWHLLEIKARPGTVPGHLLTLGVLGKAMVRDGKWKSGRELLDSYAVQKGIDPDALRRAIEAYLVDCGWFPRGAGWIIEKLIGVNQS